MGRFFREISKTTFSVESLFPMVRVSCLDSAQNLSYDATAAEFPTISYDESSMSFDWTGLVQNASIEQLDRNSSTSIRMQWVSLPATNFGSVSTGLLFEMPWVSAKSRTAVGCTVQASWRNGTIVATSNASYFAWHIQKWKDAIGVAFNTTPLIILDLDPTWMELLTPDALDLPIPTSGRPLNTLEAIINSSTIDNFMSDKHEVCDTVGTPGNGTKTWWWNVNCNDAKLYLLEAVTATVIADGLSRYQNILAFTNISEILANWQVVSFPPKQTYATDLLTGNDAFLVPPPSWNVSQLFTSFALDGYAYWASSATDYLSMVVAGLYVLLVVSHLAWLSLYQVSSSAWDSVTELVVLCQNSPPTAVLRGTSAGIGPLRTYKKMVRLCAIRGADDKDDEHVILVFGEDIGQGQEVDQEAGDQLVNSFEGIQMVERTAPLPKDIGQGILIDPASSIRYRSLPSKIPTWPVIGSKGTDFHSNQGSQKITAEVKPVRIQRLPVEIDKKYY